MRAEGHSSATIGMGFGNDLLARKRPSLRREVHLRGVDFSPSGFSTENSEKPHPDS